MLRHCTAAAAVAAGHARSTASLMLRRGFVTAQLQDYYGLFVNGQWKDAQSKYRFDVEDPSNGNIITKVASGGSTDIDYAVKCGRAAFDDGVWSRADPRERAAVMNRAAAMLAERVEEMAELEVMQTGRAVREMKAQLGRLPEWFEYFAAVVRTAEGSVPPFKGDYLNYVTRVPLVSGWLHRQHCCKWN